MKNGHAIVSLHDVTPAFMDEIGSALGLISEWGLPSPALLVVPRYHDQWEIGKSSPFLRLLEKARSRGSEIVLHGWNHLAPSPPRVPQRITERLKTRFLTAGEGEFQYLSRSEALRRAALGRAAVEDALGERPSGFIPPAWLLGSDARRVISEEQFEFWEDHIFIHHLSAARRLFAPAVTFTARSRLRAQASIAWAGGIRCVLPNRQNVRLALHPVDFRFPELIKAIALVARKIGRQRNWVTYDEFLGITD